MTGKQLQEHVKAMNAKLECYGIADRVLLYSTKDSGEYTHRVIVNRPDGEVDHVTTTSNDDTAIFTLYVTFTSIIDGYMQRALEQNGVSMGEFVSHDYEYIRHTLISAICNM